MAAEILPAVLAHTFTELTKRLKLARTVSSKIHLDVMDGIFVRSRSVGQKAVRQLKRGSIIELHLMTKHPERWLPLVVKLNIRRVIVHVELGRSLGNVIALYRDHHRSVILAINPRTPLTKIKPWIKSVQGILIMGVQPGKYHAPWEPITPARIKVVHRTYPRTPVACDGGMNPDTITQSVQAGAKRIVVGSYLQYHQHPKQAWRKLRKLAAGGEK